MSHPSAPPTAPGELTTPAVGLGRIGQIAVPVADLARATAFYRDVLGMRFLFETPTMAFFDADGVRLMLTAPPPSTESGVPTDTAGDDTVAGGAPDRWVLYYRVKELELAVKGLTERGAPLERGPQLTASLPDHDLWMAFIRDSEQNLIGLMYERPR